MPSSRRLHSTRYCFLRIDDHHYERGVCITIYGVVIYRQWPGTAGRVVFVSVEDETGIADAVVSAGLFERDRLTIRQERFLRITCKAQMRQGLPMVQAEKIECLSSRRSMGMRSNCQTRSTRM